MHFHLDLDLQPQGGNYLAFPRMGRSGANVASDVPCCGVGLKEEFVLGDDGKEELRAICPARSECCAGLREIVDEKPDGVYYSMCIPDIPAHGVS
ncbi:small cardioactive peptide [Elysia marginata]|uniref:Small cardioactive peptide n=1 Tax=Elysia marginata TaxID=1093978 RepID=A0AAV4GAX1_9GAST|nr:small cardioactive peptide [Elysia marginata]